MRDYKGVRLEQPAEPWYVSVGVAAVLVALAVVVMTAPTWMPAIDAWIEGFCR